MLDLNICAIIYSNQVALPSIMPEKEPKLSYWGKSSISRRGFLKLVALVGGGALVSACSPSLEPTPTASPLPTARPTTEPTLTLEPPRLLETIKVDIPDLTVEKYAVEFPEITNQVSESYKREFREYLAAGPYKEGVKRMTSPWYAINGQEQCGSLFAGFDQIMPQRSATEFFYFDGETGRFYTDIIPDGFLPKDYSSAENIKDYTVDKKVLGWEKCGVISWVVGSEITKHFVLSCNGKILYRVTNMLAGKDTRYATVIADIPNATKIFIKDSRPQSVRAILPELTKDGNRLLLAFPNDFDPNRGTYLIDLRNWQSLFYTDEVSEPSFLSENGELLYLSPPTRDKYGYGVGNIYNVVTGEKDSIYWSIFYGATYQHVASANLHFIARTLGIFSSTRTEAGQFGIAAYTPEGFFTISSPKHSLRASEIGNDGTIYTYSGYIFRFEGGIYKLVKTGDAGSIEVNVRKVASR